LEKMAIEYRKKGQLHPKRADGRKNAGHWEIPALRAGRMKDVLKNENP